MKTIRALPLALALLAPAAHAQYAYDYAPMTGDPTLDAVLDTINLLFNDEPDYYVEQIVYETQAPPVYVREYIVERRYAPADVYMIGEMAQLSGRSFNDVAKLFDANRNTLAGQGEGRGWGAVARQLGIKPGSAQFHQLKNGTTVFVDRGRAKRGKGHDRGAVIVDRGGRDQVRGRDRGADKVQVQGRGKDKGRGEGKGRGKGKGNGKGK